VEIQLRAEVMEPVDEPRHERFRPMGDSGHPAVNDPVGALDVAVFEENGVRHHDPVTGDLHPHFPRLVNCNVKNGVSCLATFSSFKMEMEWQRSLHGQKQRKTPGWIHVAGTATPSKSAV